MIALPCKGVFQVYREVCAACHSLELLSFRSLGEKGAPYYDPKYPNPNDNPLIKAFAAEYTIPDIDELGDSIERPAIPADHFPPIYPNEQAARASNGGSLPPDLSVIVKGRSGHADYLYSLLTGYDLSRKVLKSHVPVLYYNPYFPGGQIAMAEQLTEDRVEYQDGTKATPDQMAKDLVTFLTWAGDPHMEKRKKTGFMVLIYLVIMSLVLWFAYREVWRNVNRKKTS